MRLAVLFFPAEKPTPGKIRIIAEIAKEIGKSLESRDHRIDVIDGSIDTNVKLGIYQYVILAAEPVGFSSRLPDSVSSYLPQAGMIAGKRSAALVLKKGLFPNRATTRLMKAMEAEGMTVNYSSVISDANNAREIMAELPLEKP